ncbi:MAG: IS256 family transposase [Candidatus Enterosoma sp.]|nr:IS256 family transposase [bacterium]MDY2895328.1 IS256 family transposase [Candidatus Enterosoma sp.]MDY3080513.1 IS256 family transposase [Candidatus Enterosoma sp.]MDY4188672.1 IS256 family transposase [Candidatus Enterosoma sp.]MDY4549759.1 IS256 family transposase [Candidatus Enterosoma sp.]
MNILSLIDGMSEEEIGKIIVGEVNSFICEKAQTLLDGLMKNEIIDFFADASNATDGNFRNGYYSRTLNTVYGPLTLRVPRDRIGQFKTKFFVPYKRTTDNICEMIQRLYVRGMTEREIVDEINDDFGTSLSRETVRTTVNKVLKEALDFNKRVIPNCPIVFLDGTYVPIKRRYEGTSKVEKECVMVALGITEEGEKVVLGFYFTPNEGAWSWDDVLADLKSRGLYSASLFVTDGLQGMPEAIHRNYPKAKHQLCLVHETRTICRDVRKSDRKTVSGDFKNVYSAKDRAEAESRLSGFEAKWEKTYPNMVRKLRKQIDLFTFMDYPKLLWKSIYTSNAIEGFNSKLKRLTRKRILMNSEDNAVITIVSCCADYNKNAGKIRLRKFNDMSDEEKNSLLLKN